MKIRIKGDSIRFRLTKTEVATLCDKGYIEETTHLGPQSFTYAVKRSAIPDMEVSFKNKTILLKISANKIYQWDKNETVGFETTVSADVKNKVHLLLEKDFVCLDERIEDQSDNYPNPKMFNN